MASLIYKIIFFSMWVVLVTHTREIRYKQAQFEESRMGQFVDVFLPRYRKYRYHRFSGIQKVSILYLIVFLSMFVINYSFIAYLIIQIPFAIVPLIILLNKIDFVWLKEVLTQEKEEKRNTYFERKHQERQKQKKLEDVEDILDDIGDEVMNDDGFDVFEDDDVNIY